MHKLIIKICLGIKSLFSPAEIEKDPLPYQIALKLKTALREPPAISTWLASQMLGLTELRFQEVIQSGELDLPVFSLEKDGKRNWWVPSAVFGSLLLRSNISKNYGNTESFFLAMNGIENVRPFFKEVSSKSQFTNEQIGNVLIRSSMKYLATLEEVAKICETVPLEFERRLIQSKSIFELERPVSIIIDRNRKKFLYTAQAQVICDHYYVFSQQPVYTAGENGAGLTYEDNWIPAVEAKKYQFIGDWVLKTFPFEVIDGRDFLKHQALEEKASTFYRRDEIRRMSQVLHDCYVSRLEFNKDKDSLTLPEAAKYLGVSEQTLLSQIINKKWQATFHELLQTEDSPAEHDGPLWHKKDLEAIAKSYNNLVSEPFFWIIIAGFVAYESDVWGARQALANIFEYLRNLL